MDLATGAVLAAAAETNNPIRPNATFIAEVVAFAILLFLLKKYALPPLSKAMTERQNYIDSQINDAREARERLDKLEADQREMLEQTRADASQIREEARAAGRAIIAELRQKAE